MKHIASALTITLVAATAASAQITLDGTADANYGAALSTQNTDSGFGNSTDADPRTSAGGSELDQIFGTVSGGFLYLNFTGNLENNFNKLEIFIDSEPGVGQNVLNGANLPVSVDGFCCTLAGSNTPDPTSGALQRMSGLTFDTGFAPDYFLSAMNGSETTGPLLNPASGWIAEAHFAELNNGAAGASSFLGGQLDPFGNELQADGVTSQGLPAGTLIDQFNNDPVALPLHEFFEPLDALGDPNNDLNHRAANNTIGLLMAVDQSNIAGVNGCGNVAFCTAGQTGAPQNVLTGFEFGIPLASIGNPTGDIKVTAFINGAGHDFASNQFGGTGVLNVNPGTDGAGNFVNPAVDVYTVNLATIAGNQFVTITQAVAIAGDLDGNGFVDILDLNIVLANWNTTGAADPRADTDGNGLVDILDLNVVLTDWNLGTPPPAGAVVPEPATLGLVALGGMAMLRRRR